MAGTDPELYLRLAAEGELLDGASHLPWDDPLVERARALVAVGALPVETAQRVVEDYSIANSLRGRGGHRHHRRGRARGSAPDLPPAPRRIAFADAPIERSWGVMRVRHILFDDDALEFSATMTLTKLPPAGAAGRGSWGRRAASTGGSASSGSRPTVTTVTDDRGMGVTANERESGGSSTEWHARYRTDRPVAVDTGWLAFDGDRVALLNSLPGVEVTVRNLTGQDPAARYLRHCLERVGDHHGRGGGGVDGALAALVGSGLLDAESDLVAETVAAADVVGSGGGGFPRPRRLLGPGSFPGGPTGTGAGPASAGVPEPWRSLRPRLGFSGGPTGTLRLGAVTPVFDGLRATVCGLESDGSGFRVDLTVVGSQPGHDPFDMDLSRPPVTFTATDNRGNFHLGALGNWRGGDSRLDGTVEFWPGLDPRAEALGITISTGLTQAVIRTPLSWDEPT